MKCCWAHLLGCAALLSLLSSACLAGPIYSTVDANGNRVFSDAHSDAAAEVRLNEATVVSGHALGKQVTYRYGQPDSGKGSGAVVRHQKKEARRQEQCAQMKELMNSSAGRIKLQTETRYHRECILGQ